MLQAGTRVGNASLEVGGNGSFNSATRVELSSMRELEVTTDLPKPGSTDGPRITGAVIREEQSRSAENGRNVSTTTIKKEQQLDVRGLDNKIARLPATSSKVTVVATSTVDLQKTRETGVCEQREVTDLDVLV